ncbi:MAG: glycosyltransferase family 2 protein [Bacteroidetes bacterium]|nr:glycosyltransferase family 2 protein [Bacteroidota bacterium]
MIYLQIIFWVSFAALAHTYIIYPLLLKVLASTKLPSPRGRGSEGEGKISILIPAYNEEKIIKQKLESIFNSDYPREKIEVIVGSDNSSDKTNDIVKSFPQVQLVEFSGRNGKPKIINKLVTLAKNEILILTDANVLFDKDTIRELAKHFSNSEIGLVDSHMQNINLQGGISKAESTYIRGESGIKSNEGKIFGMMMGPFGGCYAVRKSFYSPVPENFLVDDFYINMKVLEKGGKAISELNAKVYEEVPSDWKIEFKRKIRIATGSYQNYFAFLHLLFRFNALSFCFLSHKLLRWKGPFLMIALYITNFILIPSKYEFVRTYELRISFFEIFFLLQNLLLLLLAFDLLLAALKISSPTRLVTHFFTTNLALLIGFFKFLGGVKSSVWTPTKR